MDDQVWGLGAQIKLSELIAMGAGLNRYKEQHRKYDNFEEQLRISGIFAIYKPVLSLIDIEKVDKPPRDDRQKDEPEMKAEAEREKVFLNQLEQLSQLL